MAVRPCRYTAPAMLVFSNQQLGPVHDLLVSPEVGSAMLRATAEAARPVAQGRWEHELVLWLEDRAGRTAEGLDVSDIAWTPEHFDRQRRFLVDAIDRASTGSEHGRALERWRQMVSRHPAESVVVGRRWRWAANDAIY